MEAFTAQDLSQQLSCDKKAALKIQRMGSVPAFAVDEWPLWPLIFFVNKLLAKV